MDATGVKEGPLSFTIYAQGQRLGRLRAGADGLSRNIEDGLQWLSDNWPETGRWPEGVPRPVPRTDPEPTTTDAAPGRAA